jgi:hypothetical protein
MANDKDDEFWESEGEQGFELHPDLRAVMRSTGETLSDKLSRISPELVLRLTFSGDHDYRDVDPVRATGQDFKLTFSKTGDGWINVWGQAPTPHGDGGDGGDGDGDGDEVLQADL